MRACTNGPLLLAAIVRCTRKSESTRRERTATLIAEPEREGADGALHLETPRERRENEF